ncbi:Tannase/feruloyl esterase [Immersiella caudata]|uniref:Carboxylic ester hydrolase n=1 Tax=Immersiella caudata TaxID=314043 RepID=A0AA39WYI9_9PEZI|nr:Tannase/feruloyl esterase [Immersiella caudata]
MTSLLVRWVYVLAFLGQVLSMPTIETRQTGLDRCKDVTFSDVIKKFGGQIATGSPYTWQNEPTPVGLDKTKVLNVAGSLGVGRDICGLRVNVTPNIALELYLPNPTKWNANKRILTVGNGAFMGGTSRYDMFSRAMHDYAVMSTNTGHEEWDLSWANKENQDTLQADWAWRAMNSSVGLAKELVKAYYQPAAGSVVRSYYSGCSTGGRQGIRQMEVNPSSFDGMLIGAPAWNVRSAMPVLSRIAWISRTYDLEDRAGTDLHQRLYKNVVDRCDTTTKGDNVPDRIVSNSDDCLAMFKNSSIETGAVWKGYDCDANQTPNTTCITLDQRRGFMLLLDTFLNPSDKTYAGDGFDITSIKDLAVFLDTGSIDGFNDEFSKYFIGKQTKWDSDENGITLLKDTIDWDKKVRANAQGATLKNDKLRTILYTGTADGTVSSIGTRRLFQDAGGSSNANLAYFELPGMPHCTDTTLGAENVPWYIGGVNIASFDGSYKWWMDNKTLQGPAYDALTAVAEWVEKGTKPSTLIATAFQRGTGSRWAVSRQRPVCASPLKQVFNGDVTKQAEIDDVNKWVCK